MNIKKDTQSIIEEMNKLEKAYGEYLILESILNVLQEKYGCIYE